MEVKANVTIPYITLEASLRIDDAERAIRHLQRGVAYELGGGKPDYARGSYAKAHKNMRRIIRGMMERATIESLSAEMVKDMERIILGGTP